MVKHFQYLILQVKISHIDAYFYLSKYSKNYIKQYSKKTQLMHIMHMNNVSQKSKFVCKIYLTKVFCMKYIKPEHEFFYFTLHIASEI